MQNQCNLNVRSKCILNALRIRKGKLPKSLLVDGQCLNRVMFCLKPIDVNGSSLKLEQYLMFPNSHFCVKV